MTCYENEAWIRGRPRASIEVWMECGKGHSQMRRPRARPQPSLPIGPSERASEHTLVVELVVPLSLLGQLWHRRHQQLEPLHIGGRGNPPRNRDGE
eukprot:COSAG03_NODE_511_length_7294_cov_23.887021_4_plen_96_part_00